MYYMNAHTMIPNNAYSGIFAWSYIISFSAVLESMPTSKALYPHLSHQHPYAQPFIYPFRFAVLPIVVHERKR